MYEESLIDTTSAIVSAYVAANKVEAGAIGALIATVHGSLSKLGGPAAEPEVEKLSPAAIRKSITPAAIVSFIDGRPYKSLKRHLSAQGMTPDDYKAKYGLPRDYPMIAEEYSASRKALAHRIGLGRKPAAAKAAEAELETPRKRRARG